MGMVMSEIVKSVGPKEALERHQQGSQRRDLRQTQLPILTSLLYKMGFEMQTPSLRREGNRSR